MWEIAQEVRLFLLSLLLSSILRLDPNPSLKLPRASLFHLLPSLHPSLHPSISTTVLETSVFFSDRFVVIWLIWFMFLS